MNISNSLLRMLQIAALGVSIGGERQAVAVDTDQLSQDKRSEQIAPEEPTPSPAPPEPVVNCVECGQG